MDIKQSLLSDYSSYFNKKSKEYLKNKSIDDKNFLSKISVFTTGSDKDRYVVKKATVEKRIYVRKSN